MLLNYGVTITCFSLVAEIGWLARASATAVAGQVGRFQSRCRDWVVGELLILRTKPPLLLGFSLVAEIGWLASYAPEVPYADLALK